MWPGVKHEQSSYFKNNLIKLKGEIDALILCILRHLPDTVEGFDRFSDPRGGEGDGGSTAGAASSSSTAKLSLTSTIVREVSFAGGRAGGASGAAGGAPQTSGAGIILVQEMLEPELAGLQPRHCAGPLAQARIHLAFNFDVVFFLRMDDARPAHFRPCSPSWCSSFVVSTGYSLFDPEADEGNDPFYHISPTQSAVSTNA